MTEARATHYCIDGCGLELWGTTPTRCLPCAFKAKRERDAKLTPREAYERYLDEGLADTDGHWAPIDFESFAKLLPPRQVEPQPTSSGHKNCTHPRTKGARAICRRAQKKLLAHQ